MYRLMLAMTVVGVLFHFDATPATTQQPKPDDKDRYELRVIRVGNTFQGLRFKVTTGESWQLVVDKYEKNTETGPVAPGDFDIKLVTDDNDWTAFRIDRKTGLTWQLKNRKWVRFKEPGEDKGA
jgi:hypothetical protein